MVESWFFVVVAIMLVDGICWLAVVLVDLV